MSDSVCCTCTEAYCTVMMMRLVHAAGGRGIVGTSVVLQYEKRRVTDLVMQSKTFEGAGHVGCRGGGRGGSVLHRCLCLLPRHLSEISLHSHSSRRHYAR